MADGFHFDLGGKFGLAAPPHRSRRPPRAIRFAAPAAHERTSNVLDRIREARRNESGFTLIELLIVIVILGVLAGIVVFAVSAFNNDGKASACKADAKNVEIASEAFFAKKGSGASAIDDA